MIKTQLLTNLSPVAPLTSYKIFSSADRIPSVQVCLLIFSEEKNVQNCLVLSSSFFFLGGVTDLCICLKPLISKSDVCSLLPFPLLPGCFCTFSCPWKWRVAFELSHVPESGRLLLYFLMSLKVAGYFCTFSCPWKWLVAFVLSCVSESVSIGRLACPCHLLKLLMSLLFVHITVHVPWQLVLCNPDVTFKAYQNVPNHILRPWLILTQLHWEVFCILKWLTQPNEKTTTPNCQMINTATATAKLLAQPNKTTI